MPTVRVQKRSSLTAFWLFGLTNALRGRAHAEAWEGASDKVKDFFKETAKELKKTVTSFPACIYLELPDFAVADNATTYEQRRHDTILAIFKSDLALGIIDAQTSFTDYFVNEMDNAPPM
jgi:hypothetical protein